MLNIYLYKFSGLTSLNFTKSPTTSTFTPAISKHSGLHQPDTPESDSDELTIRESTARWFNGRG